MSYYHIDTLLFRWYVDDSCAVFSYRINATGTVSLMGHYSFKPHLDFFFAPPLSFSLLEYFLSIASEAAA